MKMCTYARLMVVMAIMSVSAHARAATIYLTVPGAPYNSDYPDWVAWTWSDDNDGEWVHHLDDYTVANGVYHFTGIKSNFLFVRVNYADFNDAWDASVWNQSVDMPTIDGATYQITGWGDAGNGNKMTVGLVTAPAPNAQSTTLKAMAADEIELPDAKAGEYKLTGELIGVRAIKHYIDENGEVQPCNILVVRDTERADHKWYQDENDFVGYDFHVYQQSSLFAQNNWVLLDFKNIGDDAGDYVGKKITGVQGVLDANKTFDIDLTLTAHPIVTGDATIKMNTYGVPFFNIHDMGRIYNENMRNTTDEGPQFVILAKPNEVALVQWATFEGFGLVEAKGIAPVFETPEKAGDHNRYNLRGKVNVNFKYCVTYLSDNEVVNDYKQVYRDKGWYDVIGLVKTTARTVRSPQWAPRRAATDNYFGIETKDWDIEYVFYPLELVKQEVFEDPSTSVSAVEADRVAVSTRYYNVSGLSSNQPFEGINIVKTTYSDGTTTVAKRFMR